MSASEVDNRRILAVEAAGALFVHGAATDDVAEVFKRIAEREARDPTSALTMIPRWGELTVVEHSPFRTPRSISFPASPSSMSVNRVMATTAAIERAFDRSPDLGPVSDPDSIKADIVRGSTLPPLPLWIFVIGATLGACSLAAIFGERGLAFVFVALAGGSGALVRRGIIGIGGGLLTQNAAAAFIAGAVSVVAWRSGWVADARLIAISPCMILLPGPHLLNGVLDLMAHRLPLGFARLGFAAMAIAALAAGLLTGVATGGQSFTLSMPTAIVPLWTDALAGSLAAGCYAISYATPLRIIAWPAGIGLVAHTVHWWTMSALGVGPAVSATCASLLVGVVMVPIAQRHRLPFAGVAFASVVSMLPGAFIFPASSGLLAIAREGQAAGVPLVNAVIGDAVTSLLVVLGLAVGLAAPKALHELYRARARAAAPGCPRPLSQHA